MSQELEHRLDECTAKVEVLESFQNSANASLESYRHMLRRLEAVNTQLKVQLELALAEVNGLRGELERLIRLGMVSRESYDHYSGNPPRLTR